MTHEAKAEMERITLPDHIVEPKSDELLAADNFFTDLCLNIFEQYMGNDLVKHVARDIDGTLEGRLMISKIALQVVLPDESTVSIRVELAHSEARGLSGKLDIETQLEEERYMEYGYMQGFEQFSSPIICLEAYSSEELDEFVINNYQEFLPIEAVALSGRLAPRAVGINELKRVKGLLERAHIIEYPKGYLPPEH